MKRDHRKKNKQTNESAQATPRNWTSYRNQCGRLKVNPLISFLENQMIDLNKKCSQSNQRKAAIDKTYVLRIG